MTITAEKYTYQTFWSEEDREFVTTVAEFPRLSWLDSTLQGSQDGMRNLIEEILEDMRSNGE
ncbi:antitoxin HicB [Corynebacterium aquatimens]|uniref:Antitoxin HicB n=1 Tax=Corynebacterium aquatimens TaxID=1190508 RepID=A0A931E5S1_9CORY|nr:hypothetical protein [Corynebacterium aquatimens]WJY66737.1 hypothetical protein CAQUA_10250 [Corynebacterium aquatimens]